MPLCLSLRVLNLSCNQLQEVKALSCLSGLEELDLSANFVSCLRTSSLSLIAEAPVSLDWGLGVV